MTEQVADPAVRRTITVDAPQARAFALFTEEMSSWWPLETHHIGSQPAVAAVMEPRAGGRWFERAADGSECEWGRVTAWEPPRRVLLAWHLTPDWTFDPDPAQATAVEVTFAPEGPSTTRVELVHSGFERFAEQGEKMREAVGSEGGWQGLLELYAEAARP